MLQWVRARNGWCGQLALFALALQLYLSFGHIHPEDLGLTAPAQAASAAQTDGTPAAPHDDDDHGICSICAALSLTANSLLPAPITLPVPIATAWTWPKHLRSQSRVVTTTANFRARAPPIA
jgi:hypothetical protein